MVRAEGLEPPRPRPPVPKTGASTNSATPAHDSGNRKEEPLYHPGSRLANHPLTKDQPLLSHQACLSPHILSHLPIDHIHRPLISKFPSPDFECRGNIQLPVLDCRVDAWKVTGIERINGKNAGGLTHKIIDHDDS